MRTADRSNWRSDPVVWHRSDGLVPYLEAEAAMERVVAEIRTGGRERVWLLEHPPLYTAGTSAKAADLVDPERFPVHKSPRGGQYTYHGPGQRVIYLMLDLSRRERDVRLFVQETKGWLIGALKALGVEASVKPGRVGVWVDREGTQAANREDKIAAIGVRVRRWVTFHGAALNVMPDLSHFEGIVPCGISEEGLGVTSLADLGFAVQDTKAADEALRASFERVFGPTLEGALSDD